MRKRYDGGSELRGSRAALTVGVSRTQAGVVDRVHDSHANDSGGELQVCGRDGSLSKHTAAAGNDPRGRG